MQAYVWMPSLNPDGEANESPSPPPVTAASTMEMQKKCKYETRWCVDVKLDKKVLRGYSFCVCISTF